MAGNLLQSVESTTLSAEEISQRTAQIHTTVLSRSKYIDVPNFTRVHTTDLGLLFAEYDQRFFGGQIKGGPIRLFMIYSAGNFIECTTDTPYLQIGEHKYGKPVLDRAIGFDTDLYDALKIGLISMDSTMRSNLGVGLPIDILVVRRDSCNAEVNYRIEPGEPYFQDLRERWSGALRAAHIAIPRPPYRSST